MPGAPGSRPVPRGCWGYGRVLPSGGQCGDAARTVHVHTVIHRSTVCNYKLLRVTHRLTRRRGRAHSSARGAAPQPVSPTWLPLGGEGGTGGALPTERRGHEKSHTDLSIPATQTQAGSPETTGWGVGEGVALGQQGGGGSSLPRSSLCCSLRATAASLIPHTLPKQNPAAPRGFELGHRCISWRFWLERAPGSAAPVATSTSCN